MSDLTNIKQMARSVKTWSAGMTSALLMSCAFASIDACAQDSRQVKEPQSPQVCIALAAQSAQADVIKPGTPLALAADTSRLQAAIDQCRPGQAVRLSTKNAKTAFVSGALQLRTGVSLLIDAGVTLFASSNPQDFDRGQKTCGSNDDSGKGCKPFITADHTQGSGIYGDGIIDGQGGELIQGKTESWWQIARRAQKENNRQNVPRLIEVTQSGNFTLHRVTLRNSPNFHVTLNQVDGFTAWGVRIDTPANARNTDGIDPISSRNITIAHSYIRTGDDNVAIKAGNNGLTENITIRNNHFYSGHGMSIGSETNGGVKNILVENLSMDGTTSGLRIKSDVSRGGVVQNVTYRDVCLRNVRAPIDMDTHYNKTANGSAIPDYRDVSLEHVRSLTPGRIILQGYDAAHPLHLRMQDVVLDTRSTIQREHVAMQNDFSTEAVNPKQCDQAFADFPEMSFVAKRPQLDAATAKLFAYTEVLNYAGMPGEEKISPWDPLNEPIAAMPGLQPDYIVDASSSADGVHTFNQVQAAVSRAVIDSEKATTKKRRIHIFVKPGIYRELVYVPALDTPITIYGTDATTTRISANLDAALPGSSYVTQFGAQFTHTHAAITAMYDSIRDRSTLGTFGTAVLWVKNPGFQAKNITIENAYNKDKGNARAECQPGNCPDTGVYAQMLLVHHQALAVMLDGADKVHFDSVRLLGFQDTLYMKAGKGGETARQFFNHSYIEGDVDFIFGDATAYFYQSEIKSLGDRSSSYVGAPSTNVKARYGLVFDHVRFTHDGSPYALAGKFYFSRQWFHNQRCTPYGTVPVPAYRCEIGDVDQYTPPTGTITKSTLESVGKMVVMNSVIGAHINKQQPWSNWNKNGTLPYRPAQYSAADYWANLLEAKIDPVARLGYSIPFLPDSPNNIFLAEFNNTEE
ncbi:pectinesterase family protein [Undibacterium sp. TJN19]|uniref:pectinesterase family protein n=1 Tax=Undibacterium sp. TJN19 TaxID=3413055 RepID=UPI003BF344CC